MLQLLYFPLIQLCTAVLYNLYCVQNRKYGSGPGLVVRVLDSGLRTLEFEA